MTVFRAVVRRSGETEPLQQHSFDLAPGGAVGFGRSPEQNDLVVPDPDKKVSSRHGRIECRDEGQLYAVDAGSLNGTFHRGDALDSTEGKCLGDGDVLHFGDFELHVFLLEDAAGGESGAGLDATVFSFDASDVAERTARSLEHLYSLELGGAPTGRHENLRGEIRRCLEGLTREQAGAVLRRLATRYAGGDPAGQTADEGDEDLSIASHDTLKDLAKRFVPDASLRSAREVKKLGVLLQQFYESTLGWLARSLQGRAVFEQEFGAEVTMVFQRSGNPLKGQTVEKMAEYLLDWRDPDGEEIRRRYLDAVLKDLAEHQLGLLAGVREAIGAVVERLAPERVLAIAEAGKGWSLSSKGARAWETYERLYGELLEERGKLFHDVISPAIQHGYLHQHGRSAERGGPSDTSSRGEA